MPYEFGPFVLNAGERRLLRNGRQVRLTSKVFDVLLLLVENGGRLVSREELMRRVWPDRFVEESNLTVSVSVLRKALGQARGGPRYVETESGRGYRFVAKVKFDPGAAAPAAAAARADDCISVAVLPLENASGGAELEYLSDGITESIINSLSQLPQLRVMARSTVLRFKKRAADPVSVGRDIGVRAVLTGRVRQVGDRLVIGAELVSTADGAQLWGANYARRFLDVFEVQEEIARAVAERLRVKLEGFEKGRISKRHTDSPAAYKLYLKGRNYWNKRSPEGVRKALSYFRQAIDDDPTFAAAYVGLADCYDLLAGLSALPPHEGYPKAKAAALRALELDEELAEGHASLGHVQMRYDWDLAAAGGEYRRALELNPSYATARHWYAVYLTVSGRHDEALAENEKARQLDPLSPMINLYRGAHLFFARRFDEAAAHCLRVKGAEPDLIQAHTFLGQAYAQQGRLDEAIAVLRALRPRHDEVVSVQLELGYFYATAGRVGEARATLGELLRRPAGEFVNPYEVAKIWIALSEVDEGFVWLEKAFHERVSDLLFLNVSPEFDGVRGDPRFGSLLSRIGLPA